MRRPAQAIGGSAFPMQAVLSNAGGPAGYELRFSALVQGVQDCCFPCDALGRVDLDTLSERERNTYFFARIVTGHEFAPPRVHRVAESVSA